MKDLKLSMFDRRNVEGYKGPHIKSLTSIDGLLTMVTSDDAEIPLGQLLPKPARNLTGAEIDVEGNLSVTFDDGDVLTLGSVIDTHFVVNKDYVNDGLYSATIDDFKPLEILGAATEPVISESNIEFSLDLEDGSILVPNGLDIANAQRYACTLENPTSPAINPIQWDTTTDGKIPLPAGLCNLRLRLHSHTTGSSKWEVYDTETGEIIDSGNNFILRNTYTEPPVSANILTYSDVPRTVALRIIEETEDTYPLGYWNVSTSGPMEVAVMDVIHSGDSPLIDNVFTAVDGATVPAAITEWMSQGPTELDINTYWGLETIDNLPSKVVAQGDYLYIFLVRNSLITYDLVTHEVRYVTVSTHRNASIRTVIATDDFVICKYAGDYKIAIMKDGIVTQKYDDASNRKSSYDFVPNGTATLLLYVETDGWYLCDVGIADQTARSLEVLDQLSVNSIERVVPYKDGWIISGENVSYYVDETSVRPSVISNPTTGVITSLGTEAVLFDSVEYRSTIPDFAMSSASDGGFTVTGTPGINAYYPWKAMSRPPEGSQSYGWRLDPALEFPQYLTLSKDSGTFKCNALWLQKGTWSGCKLPESMEVWGYLSDGEKVYLGRSEGIDSDQVTIYFNGMFELSSLELLLNEQQTARTIAIGNIRALQTTEVDLLELTTDHLDLNSNYTVTSPHTLEGSPDATALVSSELIDPSENWAVSSDTDNAEIVFDFPDGIHLTHVSIMRASNSAYPYATKVHIWNDAEEWVEVPTVIYTANPGAAKITTLSGEHYTTKVKLVVDSWTQDTLPRRIRRIALYGKLDTLPFKGKLYKTDLTDLGPITDPEAPSLFIDSKFVDTFTPEMVLDAKTIESDEFKLTLNTDPAHSSYELNKYYTNGTQVSMGGDSPVVETVYESKVGNLIFDTYTAKSSNVTPGVYSLLISDDGETWEEVFTETYTSGNITKEHTFDTVSTKFVKCTAMSTRTSPINGFMYGGQISFKGEPTLELAGITPTAQDITLDAWNSAEHDIPTYLSYDGTYAPIINNDNVATFNDGSQVDIVSGRGYGRTLAPGNQFISLNSSAGTLVLQKTLIGIGELTYRGVTQSLSKSLIRTFNGTDKLYAGTANSNSPYYFQDVVRTSVGNHWCVPHSILSAYGTVINYDEDTDTFETVPLDTRVGLGNIGSAADLSDGSAYLFVASGANYYYKVPAGKTRLQLEPSGFNIDGTDYNYAVAREYPRNWKMVEGVPIRDHVDYRLENLMSEDTRKGTYTNGVYDLEFTVTMDNTVKFEAVRVTNAYSTAYVIDNFVIEISNDNENWTEIVNSPANVGSLAETMVKLTEVVTCKYIRFTGIGTGTRRGIGSFSLLTTEVEDVTNPDVYNIEAVEFDWLKHIRKRGYYNTDIDTIDLIKGTMRSNFESNYTDRDVLSPHDTRNAAMSGIVGDGDEIVAIFNYLEPKVVTRLAMWAYNGGLISDYKLEGSNDLEVWSVLKEGIASGQTAWELTVDEDIDNDVEYSHYRLSLKGSSSTVSLYRLVLEVSDDVVNYRELFHMQDREKAFAATKVTLEGAGHAFCNSRFGALIIYGDGEIEHLPIIVKSSSESITARHHDGYTDSLVMSTATSTYEVDLTDKTVPVSSRPGGVVNDYSIMTLPDGTVLGSSSVTGVTKADPVTGLSFTEKHTGTGSMDHYLNLIPGPDGRWYKIPSSTSANIAFRDFSNNTYGALDSNTYTPDVAKVTMTKYGELLMWPSTLRGSSYRYWTNCKISFKDVVVPEGLLTSKYFR